MNWRRALSRDDTTTRNIALAVLVFVGLTLFFLASPWYDPTDWETFHGAAQRILAGEFRYGEKITTGYYSNPPWLALGLTPLALLPFKAGWAVLSAATLCASVLVLRRWQGNQVGIPKLLLVLLSPPIFYIVIQGQIDALVMAGALLPAEWWPLVALTKPQVAAGLAFGVPRERWMRTALVVAGVLLISVALFGFWPPELIGQPTPFLSGRHNLWLTLWPFQVPAGVALIVLGIQRKDERFLVAGSPFLVPYAATSSLLGPWIAAVSFLNNWQSLAVWLSWWGAVLYRAAA